MCSPRASGACGPCLAGAVANASVWVHESVVGIVVVVGEICWTKLSWFESGSKFEQEDREASSSNGFHLTCCVLVFGGGGGRR